MVVHFMVNAFIITFITFAFMSCILQQSLDTSLNKGLWFGFIGFMYMIAVGHGKWINKMYEKYFQDVLNVHTGKGWYQEGPSTNLDALYKFYPTVK